MMRFRYGNRFWLVLSLALMLLSGIVASIVQTSAGKVSITDMRWQARPGQTISALLYKPASATAANPAPAIVLGHGWWNNREMQGPNCVELARRGYVVMSIDMYGHGNSDYLKVADVAVGGTGMYDAVRAVAELTYVQKSRIGVSGHSHGARAANFSVEIDNAAPTPLIAAVLLIDDNPVYTDANSKYTNIYGSRHVGLVADQYDEFYFRSYSPKGDVLTPPRQYICTPNAQSFLHFGADPQTITEARAAETFYEKDGALRITYTPAETHPWGTISKKTIASQIAFFDRTLGAPNPIPAYSQIWQIKEASTALGLAGFAIFLIAFTRALLNTRAFAALKYNAANDLAVSHCQSLGWFWFGLTGCAVVLGASYIVMSNTSSLTRIAFNLAPTVFTQGAVFFIATWQAINGLAALAIMTISYLLFGRQHRIDLRATGVLPGWKNFFHGIALGLLVVASAYSIVFALDWSLKTDFRLWLIAVKAFRPDKLRIGLLYAPLFALYFLSNSVVLNCLHRSTIGREDWLNMAVLALFNALAPIVLVIAQYATFYITGFTMPGFGGIFGIWLFPVIVYLVVSVVISRKIYRATNNPYIGGFINAAVVTIIAVTNTLTVVY